MIPDKQHSTATMPDNKQQMQTFDPHVVVLSNSLRNDSRNGGHDHLNLAYVDQMADSYINDLDGGQNLSIYDDENEAWKMNHHNAIEMMKDFQKRNKMSMQFLLMDKERKYMKKQYGWPNG